MESAPVIDKDAGGQVDEMDLPPPSYPPTKDDWIAYRSAFTELYWVKDKPLPEVIKIMRQRYNFRATYVCSTPIARIYPHLLSENVCMDSE